MPRLILVLAVALIGLLRAAANAADDVSIGMVRLPTAVFIALDRGYFVAENLNVTPVFSPNGAEIVPELATGKIDVALASPGASLFNALMPGYVQAVLMYGNRITTRRRDIGVRFMRAYERANAFLLHGLASRAGRSEIAALRWQLAQYVAQGLVKTTPDLRAAVDDNFARPAR